MALSEGVRLGPYQIVAPLGAGGMGEVYKATDTRLGRPVAIKVLADGGSCDPQQRRRFEQEARTVSALNHPNICVLYDVGCETPSGAHASAGDSATPSGPLQFLVMEHLEGETLSKRLRGGGVSFDQALEVGAQIADALAAAHRHGVVHRDLKPGNIMLSASGSGLHAKLLDFGLAKLRPTPDPAFESTHSAHDQATRPGAILGTLPYMAPEQLEGKATDARTDIFALGCVLYEMLTGRRAFGGDSEASVISAIMAHDPDPVAALRPATPAALDHLIRRCLQKDPEQRSESAHDLADELRWLRQTHGERPLDGQPPRRRVTDSNAGTNQRHDIPSPPAPRSRHRVVVAVGVLVFAVIGYGVPAYLRGWWPWSGDPFRSAVPRRITSDSGLQSEPAVSPDGRDIAYVSDVGGTAHIWLAQTNGTSREQITFGSEPDRDPAWNPDVSAVFFTRYQGTSVSVWKVPRLGAPEEAAFVVADAAQPSVSPTGDRLAFVRKVPESRETRVFVAPTTDTARATQVTRDGEGLWDHSHPSWSPDGRWLCYQAQHGLWKVRAGGGGATRVTHDNESVLDPVWSDDGTSIYFTSTRGGTTALWRVAVSGGTPARVTKGAGPECQPSISRDGGVLAYSTDSGDVDIFVRNLSTGVEQKFYDSVLREYMPRFLPPDRRTAVFLSGELDGRIDLWKGPIEKASSGSGAHRVIELPGKEVVHPAPSPDGRWIACYRVIEGKRNIWILPAVEGGEPVQVTKNRDEDIQPAWSPDGKWLAFASARDGPRHIWKVQVENGRPIGKEIRVTAGNASDEAPEWSPDSQSIAYVSEPKDPTAGGAEVWVTRADGTGRPGRVTTNAGASRIRWVREKQMVVSGTWGDRALSLRSIDAVSGAPTALVPAFVLGDDPGACDFDIDIERGLVLFARRLGNGNIWVLSARR